jgi:hypothetical protein
VTKCSDISCVYGRTLTLLQVLSPAAILAIDLAALTLLDLPCLVAVILGVLADEFGWIAKSFPQAFGVRIQSEVDLKPMPACWHSSNCINRCCMFCRWEGCDGGRLCVYKHFGPQSMWRS